MILQISCQPQKYEKYRQESSEECWILSGDCHAWDFISSERFDEPTAKLFEIVVMIPLAAIRILAFPQTKPSAWSFQQLVTGTRAVHQRSNFQICTMSSCSYQSHGRAACSVWYENSCRPAVTRWWPTRMTIHCRSNMSKFTSGDWNSCEIVSEYNSLVTCGICSFRIIGKTLPATGMISCGGITRMTSSSNIGKCFPAKLHLKKLSQTIVSA